MPRTFVALDLETTGLNCDRDAIIEVGAVKFRDGEPVDEYCRLVNPGRPIPYDIQQLTGITDGDVAGMPPFGAIATEVMRFVGQVPVVAHNASFDLSFLHNQGVCAESTGLDTWELASVLLPNRPSYSLGSLARDFGIVHDTQHRALSDAQAAGGLFNRLCEEALELPRATLLEIVRLVRDSGWPLATVFVDAVAALGLSYGSIPVHGLNLQQLAPASPMWRPLPAVEPLVPRDPAETLDVDGLCQLLEPGGTVGTAFATYEYRPQQVEMLRAVTGAFNQGHHMLAEAGTGTGKSLAYLLPAIAYAVKNGTRVVISTNTINLQDQLYRKDLPDLQRVLDGHETPVGRQGFRMALLKGRSNYLCPRRFLAFKNRANLSHEELRGVVRILVWLPGTQTGEQGELSLPTAADRFVWSQVCADSASCSPERCHRELRGHCFYQRARKEAESAHVLIVNHALLLADAATGHNVLPEYHHLVIDEAHHLEDAVTDQLSFRADSHTLGQLFGALYPAGGAAAGRSAGMRAGSGRSGGRERLPGMGSEWDAGRGGGLLGDVLSVTRSIPSEDIQAIFRDQVIRLQGDVEAVRTRMSDFWSVMEDVQRNFQPPADNGEYDVRMRITESVRSQPYWVEVEVSWDNLQATWKSMLKRLLTLSGGLRDLLEGGIDVPGLEVLSEEINGTARSIEEAYQQMEGWAVKPQSNMIYWLELTASNGRIVLRSAPLHVGPLVQQNILFRNDTVIMTSATLRTAGSFEYIRDRLQAHEADTITVGSPFDYQASTLLYLPADLPEPNASGYQRAVEQAILRLGKVFRGRTLALFTSYSQLKRTTQAITQPLHAAGITVLSQSTGTSRHQLLEVFKTNESTVLLGTRSFWEGVDVVGPALSALVIVRLPFAVPSDPIVAARSETFEDPFYNYSVPDAILRFRQGFGRLIRSKNDRGVVVIMDKRIQSKSYGQLFLESLPECTLHKGPLMNLPATAQRWVEAGEPPATHRRDNNPA